MRVMQPKGNHPIQSSSRLKQVSAAGGCMQQGKQRRTRRRNTITPSPQLQTALSTQVPPPSRACPDGQVKRGEGQAQTLTLNPEPRTLVGSVGSVRSRHGERQSQTMALTPKP